jgi:uncharacterized protein YdeI (YjbR/CyaY-like superfamily)
MQMKNFLTFADREGWRGWLQDHYAKEREAWLVYYKKASGRPSIDYESSVEEALCYGWIDSLIQNIDEISHARKFTPRANNLKWSESNKRRVRKLVAEGRMTAIGMEKITFPLEQVEAAAPKSSRPVFEFSPQVLHVFQANPAAWAFFSQLPPSERRNVTGWIMSAKKEETQLRRLDEAMATFARSQRLGLK